MKKLFFFLAFVVLAFAADAKHIIGGEMIYAYLGKGSKPNTSKYRITLKLFRDQNSPPDAAAMPVNVFIGIFSNDNGQQYPGPGSYFDVRKSTEGTVHVNAFPICIRNAPALNYHVGRYELTIDLPDNSNGYTAAYQTCCRVTPIENIQNSTGAGSGATYSCSIPATNDSSPEFATSVDALCGDKPFTLKFDASDPDGDSLVYAFAKAYDGGSFTNATNANPSPPPYRAVTYRNGFSAGAPLGNQAHIDPNTGIISGRAPQTGRYVVCVEVASYRNGVLLGKNRKDFIINVTNCDFAGARLDPRPVSCDGFDVTFNNDDFSPLNKTFYWEFGDPATGTSNTSTLKEPVHVYSDTGIYTYKLVVNRGDQCSDSATQMIKVYPGFSPDFSVDGKCVEAPIKFTDQSSTKYGSINSWTWQFDDTNSSSDSAIIRNPTYTYNQAGDYLVSLKITSTKGCDKSFTDTVKIVDQPPFSVTNDTLICSIDTVQLTAYGTGQVSWSPNYNINQLNSFNPLVSPDVTTTYYANYTESPGCSALDSVVVKVINQVSLSLGNDTTICLTDTTLINTVSDGLHYIWTPSNTLSSDTAKRPLANPDQTTNYQVTASVGKCHTSDNITLRTVPYPNASAGNDTAICFSESYQLHGSGGRSYTWTPVTYLDDPNIADPVSTPQKSIRYVIQVNDILGCPKPSFDTIVLRVERPVANAGPRDTSIVLNQPLQLLGTGEAESFNWFPTTGLSNPNVSNPIALITEDQQYVLEIMSNAGCIATDTIDVKVFKVKPGFYVPNAFTPNNDGLNDVFQPIMLGMESLNYFRVYNRGGQLIYSTHSQENAWDGTYKGAPQDAGVFVWTAQGTDYQGNVITEKGNVTLIR